MNEGGTAAFIVTRTPVSSQPLTVTYAISGKAAFGADYTLSGTIGQIIIPADQASAMITLNALTDNLSEKAEKTKLTINKSASYKTSRAKKAMITIMNVTIP